MEGKIRNKKSSVSVSNLYICWLGAVRRAPGKLESVRDSIWGSLQALKIINFKLDQKLLAYAAIPYWRLTKNQGTFQASRMEALAPSKCQVLRSEPPAASIHA